MEKLEKKTLENNKLIAEFMGYETGIKDNKLLVRINDLMFEAAEFHKSWDWLMPVLEKIGNLPVEIEECNDEIRELADSILSFDIKKTHEKTAEFIKWYNNENNN